MAKIINVSQQFLRRDLWASLVIPLMVTIIPYLIITYLLYQPHGVRSFWFWVRIISLAYIGLVGLLGKGKIRLLDSGFFETERAKLYEWEEKTDKFLTVLIWPAFFVLMGFYIPALLVLWSVIRFAKRIWVQKFIDGIIYVLSIGALYVFGVELDIRGTFSIYNWMIISNHEGFLDYFIWPVVLAWHVSKIVAGNNLLKFPVLGSFFKVKCIIVDRTNPNPEERVKSGRKVLRQIKECLESFIRVWLGPDGRERRSHNGMLKPHEVAGFMLRKAVTPVLVLGSGAYKPPAKGEPLAAKGKKFQRHNSPRKILVIIGDDIYRLKEELDEEFRNRCHIIMTNMKREALGIHIDYHPIVLESMAALGQVIYEMK